MPLVSGVCRSASAPTLSHGGSRLNASKPEACPKTSCPPKTKLNKKTRKKLEIIHRHEKRNRDHPIFLPFFGLAFFPRLCLSVPDAKKKSAGRTKNNENTEEVPTVFFFTPNVSNRSFFNLSLFLCHCVRNGNSNIF
jgi:hypothetical protein